MTDDSFDPSLYTLHVEWYDDDTRCDYRLSDAAAVGRLALEDDLVAVSFSSDCPDRSRLLECLAPLAHPDMDEIDVNNVAVVIANGPGAGSSFVPMDDEPGVEVLAAGSATWASGGPCEFAQYEELLRFGQLYWVNTTGDSERQRVAVGRFDTEADGLAAAVAASFFFSFDPDGELVCELDSWTQEA
jgi:hypothetical protein